MKGKFAPLLCSPTIFVKGTRSINYEIGWGEGAPFSIQMCMLTCLLIDMSATNGCLFVRLACALFMYLQSIYTQCILLIRFLIDNPGVLQAWLLTFYY